MQKCKDLLNAYLAGLKIGCSWVRLSETKAAPKKRPTEKLSCLNK